MCGAQLTLMGHLVQASGLKPLNFEPYVPAGQATGAIIFVFGQ